MYYLDLSLGCGEFEEGCDYTGNDLALHIDGMTRNKCSCGCYKEPKCNAWTYIGINYRCAYKVKSQFLYSLVYIQFHKNGPFCVMFI